MPFYLSVILIVLGSLLFLVILFSFYVSYTAQHLDIRTAQLKINNYNWQNMDGKVNIKIYNPSLLNFRVNMIVLRLKHENLELVEVQKLDPIVLPYREFMNAELSFDIDPVNTAAGLSLKFLEELRNHTGDWRILLKRFRYEPITFEGFVRVNWIFYSRVKFTKTVEELLF